MSVSFETTTAPVSRKTTPVSRKTTVSNDNQLINKALRIEKELANERALMHSIGESHVGPSIEDEYGFRRVVKRYMFVKAYGVIMLASVAKADKEDRRYMEKLKYLVECYKKAFDAYECGTDECSGIGRCKDCLEGASYYDLAGYLYDLIKDLLDFARNLSKAMLKITNEEERFRTVKEMLDTKLRPILNKEPENGMEKKYPGISKMLLAISVNTLVNVAVGMRSYSYESVDANVHPEIKKFGEEMEEIGIVPLMISINYCFGFGYDFPQFVFKKLENIFKWFCKINKFGFDQMGEHSSLDYTEKYDLEKLKEKSKDDVFEMKTFINFLMKPEDGKNENINTGSDDHINKIVSVRESLIRRNENYFDNFQYGIHLFELTFGNLQTYLYGYCASSD